MSQLRSVRGQDMFVRAPRVLVDGGVMVESKTMGTDVAYTLATENVSKSGLLLTWDATARVPFIVNTLIEMTIDPFCRFLDHPVACIGKVVRRDELAAASASDRQTRLGIRIVQIENEDMGLWENCVTRLEKDGRFHPDNFAEPLTSVEAA